MTSTSDGVNAKHHNLEILIEFEVKMSSIFLELLDINYFFIDGSCYIPAVLIIVEMNGG